MNVMNFCSSPFYSEGKAMELLRKLREKPRGLDVTRASHSLQNTVLSCGTEVGRPPGRPFPFLLSSCSDQRCSGDSQEVVRLVVQAVQFYERKVRDFYTHLRYGGM